MRKEQGFTLIELLIVVAIIAIIAAIAVPNLMTARMAANETSAVSALRNLGSAQVSYAAENNGLFADITTLIDNGLIDGRYDGAAGSFINGYKIFEEDTAVTGVKDPAWKFATDEAGGGIAGFSAGPVALKSTGRYCYAMGPDMVVRFAGSSGTVTCAEFPNCGSGPCVAGNPVGGKSASGS